jgi:hypothetical protein
MSENLAIMMITKGVVTMAVARRKGMQIPAVATKARNLPVAPPPHLQVTEVAEEAGDLLHPKLKRRRRARQAE